MILDISYKRISFIALSLFICVNYAYCETSLLNFDFYGQEIQLNYDQRLAQSTPLRFEESAFAGYLEQKEVQSYSSLLEQLLSLKNEMLLNDWMYYELMHQSIEQIMSACSTYEKTLFSCFLLAKSGYDSRITFLNKKLWVNVHTEDEMFEISTIMIGNKNYVNVTAAINKEGTFQNEVYLLDHKIAESKQAFSFKMDDLPKLSPNPKNVSCRFNFKGREIAFDFEIDQNLIAIINNYPAFDEVSYLSTPLSPTAIASLRPQLITYMEGMNEETQLEFLVSFTRMAFEYKEDHQSFGKNKPMIAEEVFFHSFSDCEDRCALFYNLNKITIDLPLLVIALPDHLSIAVAMKTAPSNVKNIIKFNGQNYYFCDPTGPYNAHHIGSLPKEYQNARYEILSTYK